MKLCTGLCASRGRPGRLLAMLYTAFETVNDDELDIIIKLDDDDVRSIEYEKFMTRFKTVKIIKTPRRRGYADLGGFFTEMDKMAVTPWVWVLNDDFLIRGKGWIQELAKVPEDCMAQPKLYSLNRSKYFDCKNTGCPFAPRGWYKKFANCDTWDYPNDMAVYRTMHETLKHEVHILNNLEVHHDWDRGWQ